MGASAKMRSRSAWKPHYTAYLLILVACVLVWQLSHPSTPQPLPSASPKLQTTSSSSEEVLLPKPATTSHAPVKHSKHPRIAIITFITSQKSYIHISLKNKDHYARRHGYDFFVDYESHAARGVLWLKFDMVERLIKKGGYDWIWWMDFDTLITNTDIKLEDVITESLANATNPDDVDYLFTNDCNGLNAGSFIVRAHPRSTAFFDRVRSTFDDAKDRDEQWSEQDSMVHLLTTEDAYNNYAYRVPQWKLNAFPEEIRCFDDSGLGWAPGAFVIHFAGAWAHVEGDDPTGQLMRKYEHQIIWGESFRREWHIG